MSQLAHCLKSLSSPMSSVPLVTFLSLRHKQRRTFSFSDNTRKSEFLKAFSTFSWPTCPFRFSSTHTSIHSSTSFGIGNFDTTGEGGAQGGGRHGAWVVVLLGGGGKQGVTPHHPLISCVG